MSSHQPDPVQAHKRDRVMGLLIVAVAFLATLSIAWWAKRASTPETPRPPAPPTTEGVVGFPAAVDPLATLEAARQRTPRTELRGIVMENVKSDGTVDVSTGVGKVEYIFQSKPGEGPQPERDAGARRLVRPYCGKQQVRVGADGMQEAEDVPTAFCPSRDGDALPAPRCGPREVWTHAKQRGVPDQPARIEYYQSRAGPAWRFSMPGTKHPRFSLYGDCERELSGGEAIGSVP